MEEWEKGGSYGADIVISDGGSLISESERGLKNNVGERWVRTSHSHSLSSSPPLSLSPTQPSKCTTSACFAAPFSTTSRTQVFT